MTLTAGTLMFAGGIAMIAVSLLLLLIQAVTSGGRKRRMEERMKEKY